MQYCCAMDPTQRLTFVITEVAAEVIDRAEAAIAHLGLDRRSLRVLFTLAQGPETSQQYLGQQLGIDRTTMVSVVDELEAAGRLVRERSARDRRSYVLQITPAGYTCLAEADLVLQHCEDEFVATLSPAQRSQLLKLLLTLQRTVVRPPRHRVKPNWSDPD